MSSKTSDLRVVGIKASTIGMVQGTFLALIGLATAISHTVVTSIDATKETENLLNGLTLGITSGVMSIILVPIIYFVVGWVVGFLQGIVLNIIIKLSGGVVLKTSNSD